VTGVDLIRGGVIDAADEDAGRRRLAPGERRAPVVDGTMLRVPGARAAVEKAARPLLGATESRMPPFTLSMKDTEPVGVLPADVTCALKRTTES